MIWWTILGMVIILILSWFFFPQLIRFIGNLSPKYDEDGHDLDFYRKENGDLYDELDELKEEKKNLIEYQTEQFQKLTNLNSEILEQNSIILAENDELKEKLTIKEDEKLSEETKKLLREKIDNNNWLRCTICNGYHEGMCKEAQITFFQDGRLQSIFWRGPYVKPNTIFPEDIIE